MKNLSELKKIREEERCEQFKNALAICSSKVSIPLYLLFWLADFIYAPMLKWKFLLLRMVIVPVSLFVNYLCKQTRLSLNFIQNIGVLFTFINGILITIMIFLTSGASSPYYAGLNLVTLCTILYFPWTTPYLVVSLFATVVPYYIGILIHGIEAFEYKDLFLNSFFMFGTIAASLVLRWLIEIIKLQDIARKEEIKSTNIELESALKKLKSAEADLIQSEKLASLGTLAAGIGHELNNSLNPLLSYIPMSLKLVHDLPDGDGKNKLNKYLELMKQSSSVSTNIIKSLKNFTSLSNAPVKKIEIAEVVSSVLTLSKFQIKKDVTIKTDLEANLIIYGNSISIHQILMNLILNANDAVGVSGEIVIAAKTVGDTCELKVSDNGTGIPDDIQKRIYDPFFTTKEVGKGTGLGLYIVYNEVKSHGGSISLESKAGVGTCFTIVLPKQGKS